MFTFKPYDDSDINGWRKDDLTEDQKNEFHFSVHCDGLNQLDDMLYVRMNRKVIQFFRESDEVSDAQRGRVVAAISLTNQKDTGHDLLFFAEHTRPKSVIPNDKECRIQANRFLNRAQKIFSCFPFITDPKLIVKKNDVDEFVNPDQVLLRLCLLEFLLAIDTHDEIFAIAMDYDEIRENLRKSKVYLLLCAKLRYCMYHYKSRGALNSEEYSFVVSKYADLLMDSDFNKMVPPVYYDKPRFLYNPEKELRKIMRRDDSKLVEEPVRNKIRDYFFTKHAVVSAIGNKWLRWLYIIYLVGIGVFSAFATYSLLFFDENWLGVSWFFKNAIVWDWLAITAVAVLCLLYLFNDSLSVIMPRILVAIGIGWLSAFISEDLIKSQLEIGFIFTIIAFIGVFLLLVLLLRGEIKQHSPYNKFLSFPSVSRRLLPKVSVSWKLFPILIHAYFWVLTSGVVMQFALYDRLLQHSKALPEIVYEETFEKSETYLMHLNNCKSAIESYENDWNMLYTIGGRSTGASIGEQLNKITLFHNPDFSIYANRFEAKAKDVVEKSHQVWEYRMNLWLNVNREDTINRDKRFVELKYGDSDPYPLYAIEPKLTQTIEDMMNDNLSLDDKYQSVTSQLLFLDELLSACEKEIQNTTLFVSDNKNWETLISWSQYPNQPFEVKNTQDCLKQYAIQNNNICREVKMWWVGTKNKWVLKRSLNIFPRMLVFHSLIVLIIAFVGQLIISDKSVTEPL